MTDEWVHVHPPPAPGRKYLAILLLLWV